jgi:hypothetical protein
MIHFHVMCQVKLILTFKTAFSTLVHINFNYLWEHVDLHVATQPIIPLCLIIAFGAFMHFYSSRCTVHLHVIAETKLPLGFKFTLHAMVYSCLFRRGMYLLDVIFEIALPFCFKCTLGAVVGLQPVF